MKRWEAYEISNPGTEEEIISVAPIIVTGELSDNLILGIHYDQISDIPFGTAQKRVFKNVMYMIKGI